MGTSRSRHLKNNFKMNTWNYLRASTSDPIRPERPAIVKCLSSFDQERTIVRKVRKGDAILSRSHQRFKFKASGGSAMFDQHFGSQLERFLATLMMADHRLVGAAAGHRIQLADCTLADAAASMTEGWATEIYSWLSAVLSREDHWETRLKEVEMLPTSMAGSQFASAILTTKTHWGHGSTARAPP